MLYWYKSTYLVVLEARNYYQSKVSYILNHLEILSEDQVTNYLYGDKITHTLYIPWISLTKMSFGQIKKNEVSNIFFYSSPSMKYIMIKKINKNLIK